MDADAIKAYMADNRQRYNDIKNKHVITEKDRQTMEDLNVWYADSKFQLDNINKNVDNKKT